MKHFVIIASLLALSACSESKDSDDRTVADVPVPVSPTTPLPSFEVKEQSLDASRKGVWVYHGLKEGELVPMSKDEPWIIGTNRYMWQSNSGSSGSAGGGAYVVKAETQSFDDISSCDASRYVTDIMIPQLGTVSEEITAGWFDTADAVPKPIDVSFVIGHDTACIKLKLLNYDQGLYTLKFKRLQ